jgi:putative ABC transport system substrate-binding protein
MPLLLARVLRLLVVRAPQAAAQTQAQTAQQTKALPSAFASLSSTKRSMLPPRALREQLTQDLGSAYHVTFDEQNASGDSANCATIVNGFVSSGVDLILANATAPLQAAASATSDIPILGTSVTDYATALDIDDWSGTVGTNVSGTSDLAPLDQQAAMVKELFPDAKTVGLLYCSAEPNSIYQIETIEGHLTDEGYSCKRFSFTDTNDVASVTQKAAEASEVIYIPTDNTAASNTEAIANILVPAKIPAITGEQGICAGCGVATLSISYDNLGRKTGDMAYRVLVEGEDISQMPVEFSDDLAKLYNADIVEKLGLSMPDDYQPIQAQ